MTSSDHPRPGSSGSPEQLEERRRLWTEKLYEEHAALGWQYRVKLRRPVIRVEALLRDWGSWDPLTRTITLASRLIEQHRWDIVLEILKHEMAHQLVSETPRDPRPVHDDHEEHRPHGAAFARACEALRVADWARLATGALPEALPTVPEWQQRSSSDEGQRLLRRVEKLLSLAGSSNEHEALLAMQRVQELYAKHHLERLQALEKMQAAARARGESGSTGSQAVLLTLHLGKKRVDRLDSMICSILNEHFFVRIVHGRLFDAAELCDLRTVDLIGSRENVLMAEYVFHFLRGQIAALWEDYRQRTGSAGRARQDYMLGLLSGFRGKLSEEQAAVLHAAEAGLSAARCRALVALGDREIDACLERVHPRLTTRRWSATYRDASSYSAGVSDGRNIVIRRGVTEQRGNRGRLLPSS